MNRRTFLSRVFTGLVAAKLAFELGAATPELPPPQEEPVKQVWKVNPEWVKADYEIEIRGSEGIMRQAREMSINVVDPYPLRFVLKDGRYEPIEPYTYIEVASR